jgi:hypothetical protein
MPRRLLAVVAAISCVLSPAAPADAAKSKHVVKAVPASSTPDVHDGRVYAITRVGGKVVIGGTFTQISSPSSSQTLSRSFVAAFDASTGVVSANFAPNLDGPVLALQPAADGHSVYVAGKFTSVNGHPASYVARLQLRTGKLTAGFHAPASDGFVNAMVHRKGRLYIGGVFSTLAGKMHGGVAALHAATGAVDPAVGVQLTGDHNASNGGVHGRTGVKALAASPGGKRMVVVGNFTHANGFARNQIAMLNLGPKVTVTRNWATRRYSPACLVKRYDSYLRGVAFAPNGTYFVVVTTGGGTPGTLCDAAARWETHKRGLKQRPTWVDYAGGDSLLSVAVSSPAVYVGGHQRWMNNPKGHNSAGPGAVPRPSIAALDPVSGMPLRWNPGRNPRGFGVTALRVTKKGGLWVGSDTSYIGNRAYLRERIAHFQAGGAVLPRGHLGRLPGTVYQFSPTLNSQLRDKLKAIGFNGTKWTSASVSPLGTHTQWHHMRGAFMVDKTLFYGWSDGSFYQQHFTKSGFGTRTKIDPYHDPVWDGVPTGSGDTYDGKKPGFYRQLSSITGMFYWNGRLYYTRSHKSALFWRRFSVDSGTISSGQHRASGKRDWKTTLGMFRVGETIYFATRKTGKLHRMSFSGGAPRGVAKLVPGANAHGLKWASRGLVLYAG